MGHLARSLQAALAAAAILPLGHAAGGWESRYVEAETMAMSGFRVYWNPPAGYSGHGGMALSYVKLPPGVTRKPEGLTLSKRFARPLPAGDYRVLIRYYDAVGELRLSLGKTRVKAELPAGRRYAVIPVSISQPAGEISLRVVECGFRVIVDWIFITNDPRWQTADTSRGQRLVAPPAEAAPPPGKGNWIANASFEAGGPVGLSVPYQHNLALYSNLADAAHKVHGTRSLRVPIVDLPRRDHFFSGSEITWGPVLLAKGARCRFSAQMRTDEASRGVEAAVTVAPPERRPAFRAKAKLGPDWREVKLPVGPVEKPGPHTLSIRFEAGGEGSVWIDNLFFGTGEGFSVRDRFEAGLVWPRSGSVMRPGESGAVAAWREPGLPEAAQFQCRVYDVDDCLVADGLLELTGAPVGASRHDLPLPTKHTGVYRLHFGRVGAEKVQTWRQMSYCVLPAPPNSPPGPIGVYGSFAPQALAVYRSAGFRWTNTLSPAGHVATWNRVEPVFGKGFIFRDADVNRARRRGIGILCNVNTQRRTVFPKGLPLRKGPAGPDEIGHKQGAFPVSAWTRFVGALAEHYKGRIADWLLIDEPAYQYDPAEYFKLLKASHRAIKAADPDSRLWMHTHTVVNPKYLEVLDRLGAHEYCDGLYDYVRTRERGEALLAWARKRKRPVWTVEYGGFATFYVRPPAGTLARPESLRARDNVSDALHSAIRSLGWARAGRYYRYDARFTGHDGYMTMFEADGTLKPAGVALAVLNGLLAGLRPLGEVPAAEGLQAFAFASAQRGLLAVRHAAKGAVTMRLALEAGAVEVVDYMGRPVRPAVAGGGVAFGVDRQFRYITFAASQQEAVAAALATARTSPTLAVAGRRVRRAGSPLTLKLEVTNRTREPMSGSLCPERKSLFHFAGYVPVGREPDVLRMRLLRRFRLAPGESTTVEHLLNYPAETRFEKGFAGALLELNVACPGASQVVGLHLDALPPAPAPARGDP